MTNANSLQQRRLMYLTFNCLPRYIPLQMTLLIVMALDYFQASVVVYVAGYAWLSICWLVWLLQQFFGTPVDIFENYRGMSETEGVGQ